MECTEFLLETAIVGVVGFSGDKPLELLDVVERVLDCVPPHLGQRLHRGEEFIACERVLQKFNAMRPIIGAIGRSGGLSAAV